MIPSNRLRAATGLVALGLTVLATVPGATSSLASTRHRSTGGTSTGTTSTGTQTTTTTTAPNCGGETATSPSGAPMTCTFDDEFSAATGDATALDTSKWVPQVTASSGYTTGTWPAMACYVNSPNNISVSGGYLNLTVRKQMTMCSSYLPTEYTAGMVSTYNLFTQAYGRFEVSAKLPTTTAQGLQSTLWLWPSNAAKYGSYPASGEIDFSEFYSQYSNLDIPYIHYNYDTSTTNAATNTNVVTAYNCQINYGEFNDYVAQWQPGTITIEVNGKTCLTDNYVPNGGLSSPAPFDQPFFVALTSAIGMGTNAPTSATPAVATTQIDYVRVWK